MSKIDIIFNLRQIFWCYLCKKKSTFYYFQPDATADADIIIFWHWSLLCPAGWRLGLSQTTLEKLCIQILVSSARFLDVDTVDSGVCVRVSVCACVVDGFEARARPALTYRRMQAGRRTERRRDRRRSRISLMTFTKPPSTSFLYCWSVFFFIIQCQWNIFLYR